MFFVVAFIFHYSYHLGGCSWMFAGIDGWNQLEGCHLWAVTKIVVATVMEMWVEDEYVIWQLRR